ncbi:CHAT domain-containing protein [Chitinophaga arvensicola]|uniref:Tetratricopeptide repeat-containing protein n=1 Tax=Chitinophaga arvensicola TaxID=29529 RepID=A0A1I0SDL6_9BACT|nr:CHAT domain-containing protein [Chitinophaga arvensicola]SEW56289.1 Tetratricopeptide repeat-containing protein [Chitinophaga arvensicola]
MTEVRLHIISLKKILLLLAVSGLFIYWQDPDPGLLKQYRAKDQLTDWLYAYIQYDAATPAAKAALLKQATANAWRTPRTTDEIQAWMDLLINQGYSLLQSGDIISSTDAYQQAFEWGKQHADITDPGLALEYILKPLGNNYTRLGDYEQALFIHRIALEFARELNDRQAMAATYSNLANTAANMGQLEQSLRYCREGAILADKRSATYGLLLSEQADAEQQLQQFSAARQSISQSIRILQQQPAGNPEAAHWLFMAYQQAGDIYLDDPKTAKHYYQQALAMPEGKRSLRRREQARLFLRMGKLQMALKQPEQALLWLDSCAGILVPGKDIRLLTARDIYGEYILLDLLFTTATVYQSLRQPATALNLYQLSFIAERELRHQYVSPSAKEAAISDSRDRYETAIGLAWQSWQDTHDPKYQQTILSFMENSKSQLLWEEMQQSAVSRGNDTLHKRLRLLEQAQLYYRKEALQNNFGDSLLQLREQRVAWDLATLRKKMRVGVSTDTGSFSPELLLGKLMPGQRIRAYFAGQQTLYTIEADQQGIRFADRSPLDKEAIRYFKQHFFEDGPAAMINQPKAYYEAAYRLYAQLFKPQPLQPGYTYLLMPDGILSTLPVEALITAPIYTTSIGQWPFLVKQATVSYAYSLRTWALQQQAPTNAKGFSGFFISQQQPGLADLQGVAKEKKLLMPVVANGHWYENGQASSKAFRQALEESAIVHISTHAFTTKDSIAAPHIMLSDAPFYLFELTGLSQHPAMVVLSACKTGDGRLVTGEGIQSMAHAFMAAGTPAVVAASWNVNDATAPLLMQQFYQQLSTADNAATALQQAKLNWLKDPQVTDMHKLPYYWAALNFLGNTQAAVLPASRFSWYWLLLLPAPLFFFGRKWIR